VADRAIVELARSGDHEAFAALVRDAAARLDGAARLMLRDPELARDAVQDALIRAWRDLSALRDVERFDSWLHRLTINACLDVARRRSRRGREVELTSLHAPWVGDSVDAFADRELLAEALRRLDPEWRALVVMHFYLGMALPEAAAALGIPLGTAKSRLHRAIAGMRTVVVGDARPVVAGGQAR
jgi:RNA polymerase sigma-70 factor (ECF subfamily)